ncbi:MAG: Calx-beta domain-containing protein [Planctomycetota bacterium]|nr:Calx-beta domain-containing protein [Planctomycetota bacterium]
MFYTPCSARTHMSLVGTLCLGLLFAQCESSSSSGGGGGSTLPPNSLVPDDVLTVQEGNTTVGITVRKVNPTGSEISVDYATGDGSASGSSDYTQVSGTLTWSAGDNTDKTIAITILDDAWFEGVEQFRLDFTNAQGGVLQSPSATIFILDDETSPASTDQTQHLLFGLPTATAGAAIGDVDADGVADFLVGDGQAASQAGVVDVRSGKTGKSLFQFTGAAGERLGSSVCGLGDLDGDGVADFAMAASGTEFFIARVMSGKTGLQLYEFKGISKGVWTNMRVGSAGDVDKDGTLDVVLGLPQSAPAFGEVRIFSGKDGTLVRTLSDGKGGASFGSAIAGGGDINRDGFADLLVGAPGEAASVGGEGVVYLLSGQTGGELARLLGASQDAAFGTSVALVGDLDNDATPDFMVGAPGAQATAGETQVFSGRTITTLFTFRGGSLQSGHGASVASAGDVNQDGSPDLLIGEPGDLLTQTGVGAVKIYSGADGALLFRYQGLSTDTNFGRVVSSAGDVNGDGADDVLLGGRNVLVLLSGKVMSLTSESYELSLSQGGDVVFNLDAGSPQGLRDYIMAGSLGTSPGMTLGGIHVPLNSDAWFQASLLMYLNAGFEQMRGRLDIAGRTKVTLRYPQTPTSTNVGITVYHAIIVNQSGTYYFASNPVPLTFLK